MSSRHVSRWWMLSIAAASAVSCQCDPPVAQTFGHAVWVPQTALSVVGDEATLDFGPVRFGESRALNVELQNDGNGRLTLRAPSAGAPFAMPALDASLSATTNTSLTITFMPVSDGSLSRSHAEEIVISTEGSKPQQTLVLHLVGVGYSVDCELPQNVEFGAVLVGETVPYAFQFSNPSAESRVIELRAPHGSDSTSFSWGAAELSVAPGATGQAALMFRPTEPREYFALASLRAAESCPETTMTLHGVGLTELLSWSPVEIDCGWVPVGQRRVVTVTFTNHARSEVALSAFQTTADAEAPVGVVDLSAESVTPVEFACRPQALGSRTAIVSFSMSLASQPAGAVTFRMKGGGPEINVVPNPLNFGRIAWSQTGATTTSRQLTVRNLGARPLDAGSDANLHLLGEPWLTFTSRDAGVSVTDVALLPAPLDVATGLEPNQRTTARVSLTPAHSGELRFAVKVASDDGANPEVTVEARAMAVEAPPCQLMVSPVVVEFGVLAPDEARHATITLRNQGVNADELCFLSDIDLAADAASQGFSLEGGRIESAELGPQQQLTLTVLGMGTAVDGSKQSELRFEVNTPGNSLRAVALRSVTAPKCIEIYPAPLNFGNVPVGCRSVRSVSIYNVCSASQTLVGVTSDASDFSIDAGMTNLAPANAISVPVAFTPFDAGLSTGVLSADFLSGVRLVDVTGVGVTEAQIHERFVVPAAPQLDLLFAEDTLFLSVDQDAGAAYFESAPRLLASVVSVLSDAGFDFHVGVVAAAWDRNQAPPLPPGWQSPWGFGELVRPLDGGFPDGYITRSTPQISARFEELSRLALNSNSVRLMVPFEASARAFSEPFRSTVNYGFRRTGVAVGVVAFGSVSELSSIYHPTSVGTPWGPFPVSYYERRFLENSEGVFSFSALRRRYDAGTPDCGLSPIADEDVDNGRIGEMASRTGGVDIDFCASWSDIVYGLATSLMATSRRFVLRGIPDSAAPMVVSVNGSALSLNEWVYLPDQNAIELVLLPPPLANVDVSYFPICE